MTPQHANPTRRAALLGAVALVAGVALQPASAWAQAADGWPNRSIRIIVPFVAGGATDVVARIVSQKLSEALGQPVVIDNRGGANGAIGTEAVARATPDGYTLLLNTAGAQTLSPALQKTGYEPLASFAPISLLARIGFVMVVNPTVPAHSVQELIALAKKPDGKPLAMSSGSSMIGLISEKFKTDIGAPGIVNAQYKGTAPQLQAVVGGEVDMTIDPFVGLQMIKAGKVRPLAVLSEQRSPALPQVPTMKESGLPDMTFQSWAALLAPVGTPATIVKRLNTEVVRIMSLPDVHEQLQRVDYEPVASSPEQLAATIRADAARWAQIAKTSTFKPGS